MSSLEYVGMEEDLAYLSLSAMYSQVCCLTRRSILQLKMLRRRPEWGDEDREELFKGPLC